MIMALIRTYTIDHVEYFRIEIDRNIDKRWYDVLFDVLIWRQDYDNPWEPPYDRHYRQTIHQIILSWEKHYNQFPSTQNIMYILHYVQVEFYMNQTCYLTLLNYLKRTYYSPHNNNSPGRAFRWSAVYKQAHEMCSQY